MRAKPEPGQPILIDIGEAVYELKFPLRILKTLDADQGINVLKGAGMEGVFTDPEKLAILLYYGLRTKHPEVSLEWVEDNVDASMLLGLAPRLAYATTGRYPKIRGLDEDEDVSPNGREESLTTGSPSGPQDDTTSVSESVSSGD
jgi:hypothetical protein